MTYSAVYCALISKRLKNPITKDDCYVEKHHIIPKSEGGTDEPDNLVNLTAREHYIAHLLLAKIYDDHKMWCALALFRRWKNRQTNFRFSSRIYEQAKKQLGEKLSKLFKGRPGKPPSAETRLKISIGNMGNKNCLGHKVPDDVRQRMSDTHKRIGTKYPSPLGKHWFNNGKTETYAFECPPGFVRGRCLQFSDEAKKRMSDGNKLRRKTHKPLTEEHKRKLSDSSRGLLWYNNGEITKRFKGNPPEGWTRGRIAK